MEWYLLTLYNVHYLKSVKKRFGSLKASGPVPRATVNAV